MKPFLTILSIGLLFFSSLVRADYPHSAIGFWMAVDDKTNKVSSIIQIWQSRKNLKYYGRIYKVFASSSPAQDHSHGKSMVGTVIIRDMIYQNGQYVNGWVLDPRDNSLYHAKMTLTNDGRLLKLRGYLGIPLLGRTAQWTRVG